MRGALSVWLWSCLFVAAPVAAQTTTSMQGALSALPALPVGSLVAVLPPANAPDMPARANETANADALQALQDTLRAKGYRVLPPEQVSAALVGHTAEACRNAATCDPQVARTALEADAVVSLAVWQRPGAPDQVAIHVRRARGYGQAELAVAVGGIYAAASDALLQALDDSRHTHEIVVRIESEPVVATLHVDQTITARTPARLLLLPGNHLVSVEAPGYVTRARYIDVPERAQAPLSINVELTRVAAGAELATPAAIGQTTPARPHVDSVASPWNYVLAVGLFGAAVPLLANAIYTAATRGSCVGEIDPQNRCAERVVIGPGFYASIGLASAALLGGTSFLILRPISSDSGTELRGALLHWQRTF